MGDDHPRPGQPDRPSTAFELDLDGVSRVRVVDGELELTTWSPTHGLRTVRRS